MDPFIWIALLAGLLIGSFLNVCVYRWPRDLSVVGPRSHCPECEQLIAWYDNVPVLSYLILRGKCRKCGAAFSARYLAVELATGFAFAFCVWKLGLTLEALKFCTLSAILIALIATDFEERILPDEFTKGGIVLGMIFAVIAPMRPMFSPIFLPVRWDVRWLSLGDSALAAGFASGSIWLVGYLYEKFRHKEGLGFGDVKMIGMVGAFLGLQGALGTLLFGSLSGSILGMAYIKLRGKDPATYELPFGSFLGASALVLALYGEVLKR